MKSLYIKAEHCFKEQPALKELDKSDFYSQGIDGEWTFVDSAFEAANKVYENRLASLRTIPCRPADIWQEGVLYEERFQYELFECDQCDGVGTVEGGRFIASKCLACNGGGLIIKQLSDDEMLKKVLAINETLSAPPQSEGELWKELLGYVAESHSYFAIEMGKGDWKSVEKKLNALYDKLQHKYNLTRKSDVPEAVAFAEWAIENFHPMFSGDRKLRFWIKNSGINEVDITTAEAYNLFIQHKTKNP